MFIQKKFSVFLLLFIFCFTSIAGANQEIDGMVAEGFRDEDIVWASDHAPLGVMGDHRHHKGEWMFAYRYKAMFMKGNRNHTTRYNTARVHETYMVAPTKMRMQMHMLGAMYAPNDDVTFMLMLPIVRSMMEHVTRAGLNFKTTSEGSGDLKLSSLIKIADGQIHDVHLNAGISIPVGAINEEGTIPTSSGVRLPYPMQIGSGTWDLLPGITYNGRSGKWNWGAQANAVIRPGRNKIGYSLGNRYDATVWGAKDLTEWLSTSTRFHFQIWGDIDGRDRSLVPAMVPTADPNLRGGRRMDTLLGFNLIAPKDHPLEGHRLAFEAGVPVYQFLDGPQLETDWFFTVGWQKAFG